MTLFWLSVVLATCWIRREVHLKAVISKIQARILYDTVFVVTSLPDPSVDHIPDPTLVFAEIKKAGILHPEIVLRQAIVETGWFNCDSCSLDSNNVFGFRKTKKYLGFKNWQSSVWYYKEWQKDNYIQGDYYEFLDSCNCFAEDTGYVKALKGVDILIRTVDR